jgi:M6 family metalloprotease-like protein
LKLNLGKRNFLTGVILAALILLINSTMIAQPKEILKVICEKKKGLVILAGFPDIAAPVDQEFVRDRFRKLDFYVQEMSYGKVGVDFDITEWYRLPNSIKKYTISPANLKVDKTRVVKLIQDAIDAADEENDFSRYSFVVLFLGAQFKEYGMIGLCGYPGMLGWSQDIVFRTRSGQTVPGGVAIFTYQAHLGTLFHDIAHVWGGVRAGKRVLPCLYDHDIQEKHPTHETGFAEALINMGYWDPLSCHFYKWNVPPPGLSSWTKLRLGWIAQEQVRVVDLKQGSEIVLGPLEDGSSETLVIKIPLTESKFYLIENRQPVGSFDPYLPGKGILIMAADDSIDECRLGKAPVKLMNADPAVPYLQGANFDLPGKEVFIDKKNGIEIRLVEKLGDSYRIRISKIK